MEGEDDDLKNGDSYQPMQMHAMEDEDDVDIKTEDSYSQPMEIHGVHDEADDDLKCGYSYNHPIEIHTEKVEYDDLKTGDS